MLQNVKNIVFLVRVVSYCFRGVRTENIGVDPSGDMLDTFVGQMANGYGTIVRQALAWTGK